MSIAAPKSERIEVRTTPAMKALLQRAADSSRKSLTEFLLEAGANAAEEALVSTRRCAMAGVPGSTRSPSRRETRPGSPHHTEERA